MTDVKSQTNVNQLRTENQNTPLSPVVRKDVGSWGTVANVKVDGPLSALQKNEYNPFSIAYPRDIDSFDKGHAIQFNIREIIPFKTNFNEAKQKITEVSTQFYDIGKNIVNERGSVESIKQGYDAAKETLSVSRETVSDKFTTVRLYMPDTLAFNYQAQYDKLSLADAINSTPLVGKISTAITSMVTSNLAKMVSGKLGYTFNPQQQMLFEGIDFREFDLQFTFTPTSQDEAANVKEIIRILKRSAAPTKMTGSAGFFWTPPSVFDIGFFFNGQINKNVPPVLRCVLQSVNVDYAPNGWSALNDGAPVQTTLSLSFREIELLDRDMIDSLEG